MQNDVSQPAGIAGHVEVAAEALRVAIHTVYNDVGSDAALVGELYLAVGDVELIVDRLPQLLRHMERRLVEVADRTQLGTDDAAAGSGPESMRDAAAALSAAAFNISQMSTGRNSPIATARERLAAISVLGEHEQ